MIIRSTPYETLRERAARLLAEYYYKRDVGIELMDLMSPRRRKGWWKRHHSRLIIAGIWLVRRDAERLAAKDCETLYVDRRPHLEVVK